MRSFPATRGTLHPAGVHPALWRFAEECNGLFARLLGYMGALALITMAAVALWDEVRLQGTGPAPPSNWRVAARAHQAFAVTQPDSISNTGSYETLQHPDGGRKDVFRWTRGDHPVAELEIYRPGEEARRSGPPIAELAARIDPGGTRELQAAGLVDTKFGAVALLGLIDRDGEPACLGFIKRFDEPSLRISGWSCQGDALPSRRAAIGCMLNRLVLLTGGNDPKVAELFARAELKRGECTPVAAAATRSADWITGAQDPLLRGGL